VREAAKFQAFVGLLLVGCAQPMDTGDDTPADTGTKPDSYYGDDAQFSNDSPNPMDSGVQPDVTTDTGTKDAMSSCPSCPLKVQYKCMQTMAVSQEIKPHLQIVNQGSGAQNLSELTVRYWFTNDGNEQDVYWCDYATIGCGNLSGNFVTLNMPKMGADRYLEVSFGMNAGSIAPDGGTSGEIQNRFNKQNYPTFTQTGDYSFDPNKLSFTDWDHVTLYKNGMLVWGTEP
jgi:hypothetical protein